jgi:hypothetical protein
MADLVVVVGVIAFFAICVWFVWACDRIIGPDPDEQLVPSEVSEAQEAVR